MTRQEKHLIYTYIGFLSVYGDLKISEKLQDLMAIVAISEAYLLDCDPLKEALVIKYLMFIIEEMQRKLLITVDITTPEFCSIVKMGESILFDNDGQVSVTQALNKVKEMVLKIIDVSDINKVVEEIMDKAIEFDKFLCSKNINKKGAICFEDAFRMYQEYIDNGTQNGKK